MKNTNYLKNKNILHSIGYYRDRILNGILNISSLFFIALTLSMVIFSVTASNNRISILVIWMILLFITSNKYTPSNIRLLFIKITNTIGSLFFLALFLSSWFNPQNFLAKVYEVYIDILQVFLNQFLVTMLLAFILIIVFIEALKLILKVLGYLFDKLNASQGIRTTIVTTIVIASCVVLITVTNKESGFSAFKFTPYFVPFFGFSLLYLHLNFLIRELVKFGQSSTLSN